MGLLTPLQIAVPTTAIIFFAMCIRTYILGEGVAMLRKIPGHYEYGEFRRVYFTLFQREYRYYPTKSTWPNPTVLTSAKLRIEEKGWL